jgi:N-methylhydantoinase B/oxoprolinase/acetone carboxylase alpha subunit
VPAQAEVASRADAVTAEIIRNALVAITDEMKTNLMRTAYNMIIANGKLMGFALAEGDTYVGESGGGGGFGDPLERPLAAVAADLRAGYVSPEAARRDYGVELDASGTPSRPQRGS